MVEQGFWGRERNRTWMGQENCPEIRMSVCASGGVSVWLWAGGAALRVVTGGRRWGLIDTEGELQRTS